MPDGTNAVYDESGYAWLSRGFEQLARSLRQSDGAPFCDVLVIGSGYGGAVAADAFAGASKEDNAPVRVVVLERGREYVPGQFPTGIDELPRHVRSKRRKEGLFDIRPGTDVSVVLANGVGGGSLINAGVMEPPRDSVFAQGWPQAIADPATRQLDFDEAKEMLGARRNGADNTILDRSGELPAKYTAFAQMSGGRVRAAAISVAMDDVDNSAGVRLNRCIGCGDCATGCNHGAKDSLDTNLLARAHQHGATVYSGATVLDIRKASDGNWIVRVVPTHAGIRARESAPYELKAAKVVVAAGTLGSAEILNRSSVPGELEFSAQLGKRCSTNGDAVIVDYGTNATVNAVAADTVKPSERKIGPTITGILDERDTHGVLIEEMAVPASLRAVFGQLFATANTLHSLGERDCTRHATGWPEEDIYALRDETVQHCALYAAMGDDGAGGVIDFRDGDEGTARMTFEGLRHAGLFSGQVDRLQTLTSSTGGRVLPNPGWKVLPDEVDSLVEGARGPLLTVHPLGGCAMADTVADGVVDEFGRVFDLNSDNGIHAGLVVLDGSVIPTALGTNPALTIAAVAVRACTALREDWHYTQRVSLPLPTALGRPTYRETDVAESPEPTTVRVTERLVGPVTLRAVDGQVRRYQVELTLRYQPKPLPEFHQPHVDGGAPLMEVDTAVSTPEISSRIRVFEEDIYEYVHKRSSLSARELETTLDAVAAFSAPLEGTLRIFQRRRTCAAMRLLRSGWAWLLNRGLRDIWQAVVGQGSAIGGSVTSLIGGGTALATRAGEIRELEYALRIGQSDGENPRVDLSNGEMAGRKQITYKRRANPLRQMMLLPLESCPQMVRTGDTSIRNPVLELDVGHLARIGVPLFEVVGQRSGTRTMVQAAELLGYFLRLLLGIHVLTFRKPDADLDPQSFGRLPVADELPDVGLPRAEIHDIPLGCDTPHYGRGSQPVVIRLTRYPNRSELAPLLMIHGYSAGGTTFAHGAVHGNLASRFWAAGRDVWVADMRTSSGFPDLATQPWNFEQVAYNDIPHLVHYVYTETGRQMDVLAHCMGAVMFSMAALHATEEPGDDTITAPDEMRSALPGRIRRVAFSQVGPLMEFSAANVFRAYILRYLLPYMPEFEYSFNPPDAPRGSTQALLTNLYDRLLALLPYPEEEFDFENPLWPCKRTPWVRTRHRMDVLYGRDFNVANIPDEVLRYINDHFGALNLKTVAQTTHFARLNALATCRGRNTFVSRANLSEGANWQFPVLSVHGHDNGLSDRGTVYRMWHVLKDAGRVFDYEIIDNAGHQDSLIGASNGSTFDYINKFLTRDDVPGHGPPSATMLAVPPWIGPIISEESVWVTQNRNGQSVQTLVTRQTIRIGSRPSHHQPRGVCLIPVSLGIDNSGNTTIAGITLEPLDQGYVEQNMLMATLPPGLSETGWAKIEVPGPCELPPDRDALLVLVVYAEASELGLVSGTFRLAVRPDETEFLRHVRLVLPVSGAKPGSVEALENPDAVKRFKDAAAAVVRSVNEEPDVVEQTLVVLSELDALPRPAPGLEATRLVGSAVLERISMGDPAIEDALIPTQPELSQPGKTCFVLSSCQYPAGLLDRVVADHSYTTLSQLLAEQGSQVPRFAVLVGDQIYADATAGLFDPSTRDDRFRRPHEDLFRRGPVRSVMRQIPSFSMLDDHEIDDNWEPGSGDPDFKREGIEEYKRHQRGWYVNSPGLDYSFERDGLSFLMFDTRTARDPVRRLQDLETAHISSNLATLEQFLCTTNGIKFVATPSMLLPRHRQATQWQSHDSAVHSDGWDGYPASLQRILAFIASKRIDHVVFLSGDEHLFCFASIKLFAGSDTDPVTIHSIHTGPAHAPFAFANAIKEDFDTSDFTFRHAGTDYRCEIQAEFREARGMTQIETDPVDGSWNVSVDFANGVFTDDFVT